MPSFLPLRMTPVRRSLLCSLGLFTLAGAAAVLAPASGRAEELYKLSTSCSLKGGAPVPCTVEAEDEGPATVYIHRIGNVTEKVRITDDPVRMSIWRSGSNTWEQIRRVDARFSTNTICFNKRELCVVNPNYLNSVREDRSNTRLEGRDLVVVHFGKDGRVDASCYDEGCDLVLK
jgi:hypothetical protein